VARGSQSDVRMELAEFLSSALPEVESQALFELAASDPSVFFAELLGRHRSGELQLPSHLVNAVTRDLGQLRGE
jgi:hypothetical protein